MNEPVETTRTRRIDTLVGFRPLVRFTLRRDRVRLTVWIVAIAGLIIVSAASLPPLYPDRQSMEAYVSIATGNPAIQAFGGPGYGFDDPNIGVILVNETQLWGAVCLAFMAIFLVTRHTRTEEDEERAEVVLSSVVGRHAPMAATVAVVGAGVTLAGTLCALGFVATGYQPVGSVALAASMTVAGFLFVGVTTVAAQVANTARGAIGYSTTVLAAMFVVRGVGDAGETWIRWVSPLGWTQSGRAFAGERWWPLALGLAMAALLVGLAHWLSTRRDLGSGLVTSHGGRAHAAPWLTHPLGLALRLQRGALVGWTVGLLLFGGLYGTMGDEVAEFVDENPVYADLIAQFEGVDVTDAFFSTAMGMLALFAAGFSISATLRLRSEEQAGRADAVLTAPVSRVRWAMSNLTVAVVGTTVIILAGGIGVGIGSASVTSDSGEISRMAGAALVTVPGALVLIGVAVALWGWAPRVALAAWATLAGVFVIAFFGELLDLPQWVRDLSPFAHLPALPAVSMSWPPVVATLAVAATLIAIGLWGLCRRDIHAA
jgi:ABC-2 type transport system permease protein